MNLYLYADGAPHLNTDPTGHLFTAADFFWLLSFIPVAEWEIATGQWFMDLAEWFNCYWDCIEKTGDPGYAYAACDISIYGAQVQYLASVVFAGPALNKIKTKHGGDFDFLDDASEAGINDYLDDLFERARNGGYGTKYYKDSNGMERVYDEVNDIWAVNDGKGWGTAFRPENGQGGSYWDLDISWRTPWGG